MKSSPLGFQSVKVIALAATDVARAQRFYSETLQLEEDRESTEGVGYRIGESVLIIRQHPPTDDVCRNLLPILRIEHQRPCGSIWRRRSRPSRYSQTRAGGARH